MAIPPTLAKGVKVVREDLGWVADWCVVCREPRPFLVTRIGKENPLYAQSPANAGLLVRCEQACDCCGGIKLSKPDDYRQISKDRDTNIDTLIAKTQPDFRERYRKRLQQAERARTGTLKDSERIQLMIEPILALVPLVERRARALRFDTASVIATICTAILFLLLVSGACAAAFPFGVKYLWWLVTAAFIYTLHMILTDLKRFVRRCIIPALAKSLKQVDPTKEEACRALEACINQGQDGAKKIRPEELYHAIQNYLSRPS